MLFSRLIGLPVAWVLASRDEDALEDVASFDQVRAQRIQLAPLDAEDIAAIAAAEQGHRPHRPLRANPGPARPRLDLYHQMGAWASRAQVQLAMRDSGAGYPKWAAANARAQNGWQSLTSAERRVATLIGEGRTNKSAASELGVSVNTVATHLRAVFAKLGVQSRVQLANQLHKEAGPPAAS